MVKAPSKSSTLCLSILATLVLAVASVGCKKEKALGSGQQPTFSTDTIIFDTVFTTVGSVTEFFKVYNPHKGIMTIDQIYIEGGENSNFRLNVNGDPGKAFTNVEILAQDSIFIFVEVTVDPNNGTTPLIITDKIIFENKGVKQEVKLVAWGQDAHFFRPSSGNAFLLDCGGSLFTDKPNVFYGYGVIGEGCTFTIPAGAKVHFHPGSGIIVYKGSLNINGTETNEVVLQGDRLEYTYREVPGQWEGIRFIQPANSNITHAVIKNGFYGLWVDTAKNATDKVMVSKTEIKNMASLGIYGNAGARIDASNCLVSNCGLYGLALTYGGTFNFNHCTFANYWSESTRSTPNFYLKNWFKNPNNSDNIRPLELAIDNCIFYGNLDNEFETDLKSGALLNYTVRNCCIKSDQDLSGSEYQSIKQNIDPAFENVSDKNFKLSAGSVCRDFANTGVSSILVTDDIDDKPRPGGLGNDLGCYEF